jgi:hypothetical protein
MNRAEYDNDYIAALERHNVEIVDVVAAGLAGLPPMIWRFAVALDGSIDRYIIRDADRWLWNVFVI